MNTQLPDSATRREISALLPNGEWVFLGPARMTDKSVQEMLDKIASAYQSGSSAFFNIRSAVFNLNAFSGVRISPPNKE